RALIQIHRWLDFLELNRDAIPVADWSIADKLSAYRGEYIGRKVPMEVPTWNKLDEAYELARDPKTRQKSKLPVDFTVRVPTKQFPALLVDYEGGKGSQFRLGNRLITEDTPVQMLVLSPEGRLLVRSSLDD